MSSLWTDVSKSDISVRFYMETFFDFISLAEAAEEADESQSLTDVEKYNQIKSAWSAALMPPK